MLEIRSAAMSYAEFDIHDAVWNGEGVVPAQRITELAQRLAAEVLQLAPKGRQPVVSFDVFDTILLRNHKYELRRFWEIAEAQAKALRKAGTASAPAAEALYLARVEGARLAYATARRVGRSSEPCLDDIYDCYRHLPELGGEDPAALSAIEIAYEKCNLRCNTIMKELIDILSDKGAYILWLSDMYLPGSVIADLIAHCGLGPKFKFGYSSADTGANKATGLAFRVVAGQLGLAADEFVHLGDNATVDGRGAQTVGARSLILPVSQPQQRQREDDEDKFVTWMNGRHPGLPAGW